MNYKTRVSSLEQKIEYSFQDKALLSQSMVHASSANEKQGKSILHNERLEFLGDAVLQLIITEYLFQQFPRVDEGELTKMRACVVNERVLAQIAIMLELGQHLSLGRGEELNGGRERPSILSDALEALIGALFMDGGIETAQKFVFAYFTPFLDGMEHGSYQNDYKTMLQERIQKESGRSLEYTTVSQQGPDHDKIFHVHVVSDGKVLGEGSGKTKKDAEQGAAQEALLTLAAKE